ncbi:hypothetical protein ONZ45_g11547 [Pleurotus djamor]|nr:hypothetical protein ONZ45_g11547 [Pleurotus djamor]
MPIQLPPVVDVTLEEYLDGFVELFEEPMYDGKVEDLVNYSLSGLDLRQNTQMRFNMVANHSLPDGSPIPQIERDYDSLLGFTENLAQLSNINIYPEPPNFLATINSNVHIKVPFILNSGPQSVDPAEIPNILLGKVEDRHQIRLFFPHLKTADRDEVNSSILRLDEREFLYNNIVLPSVKEAIPASAKDWPPSHKAELFRGKNRGPGMQHSAYLLRRQALPAFNNALRRRLNENPPYHDAVFCTQIQGVKGWTTHEMFPDSAEHAFNHLVCDLDTSEGHWWVDVAVEFQDGDRAILWKKDAAALLMAYALRIPRLQADRIAKSDACSRDVNAHMVEVAGFRATFRDPVGEFSASYMQAYTTDKALTYHKHGKQHSQNLTTHKAMRGKPPKYISDLGDSLLDAREKNVAARLEVRVPLVHAQTFLMEFDMLIIRESVLSLDAGNFWSWRLVQLCGISHALTAINDMSKEHRLMRSVLTTVAALTWYTNSIHSRPSDTSAGRACHRAATTMLEDFSDQDLANIGYQEHEILDLRREYERKPIAPHNIIWMRRIYFPPTANAVRLPISRTIHLDKYKSVFGKTHAEIRIDFSAASMIRRADLPANRFPMNKGPSRVYNGPEPLPVLDIPQLADIVAETLVDTGPDVDALEEDERGDATPPETTEERFARIWRQFPCCVLQKIGNPQGTNEPSYCRLSQPERQRATIQLFKITNLGPLFTRIQYKRPSVAQWLRAVGWFFPVKGKKVCASAQTWHGMTYLEEYGNLLGSVPDDDAKTITAQYVALCNELEWLPKAESDRPISTSRINPTREAGWKTMPPAASDRPAPQIYLNPYKDFRLQWDPTQPLPGGEENDDAEVEQQLVEPDDDDNNNEVANDEVIEPTAWTTHGVNRLDDANLNEVQGVQQQSGAPRFTPPADNAEVLAAEQPRDQLDVWQRISPARDPSPHQGEDDVVAGPVVAAIVPPRAPSTRVNTPISQGW